MSANDHVPNSLMSFIYQNHLENAIAPVQLADSAGAFRESLLAILYGDALPIVPDANTLRGDIARTCRDNHRTVLLNGANHGAFRLYCAEHVLNEVNKHSAEWATAYGLDCRDYRRCWEEHYLPLLRFVKTENLDRILSPNERQRIEALTDRDDVPSAILALVIQAVFLSEDRRPHFTVYNFKTSSDERENWVLPLMAAGDQAQLALYLNGTLLIPFAGIAGLWQLGKRLNRLSPIALYGVIGAGVAVTAWLNRKRCPSILHSVRTIGRIYEKELLMPHYRSRTAYQRLIPSIPTWFDLVDRNSPNEILARAVMHTMARRRQDLLTPRDVSDALPSLPISTIPARVGRILRNGNFIPTYRGCWQLGVPLFTA